jgi:phosphohistidine phosphatase
MQLLLIRHGKAEDRDDFAMSGQPDDLRPLTRKGEEEMRAIAAGLRTIVPHIGVLATSPLTRAVQTADAVAVRYPDATRETIDALVPDAPFGEFRDWLMQHVQAEVVAAVGHNPHISELATWLDRNGETVDMKKGSALLLDCGDVPSPGRGELVWYRKPKALIELAEKIG